jgi:hypothetical protein
MANKNELISFWPKKMDPGTTDELSRQGLGPVSRVFHHREIDASIIHALRCKGIAMEILRSREWVEEMSKRL